MAAVFQIKNYTSGSYTRTIRFTEALFDDLNRVAQRYHVSFNSLILQCCEYALEQMSPEKKEPQQPAHNTAVTVPHDCPQDDPAHTGSIAESTGLRKSPSPYVARRAPGPSTR